MTKKFEIGVRLTKSVASLHELHGVAYKANTLDTHGDYMSAATLRKAAQDALANGMALDVEHDQRPLAKEHAAIAQSHFDEDSAEWRIVAKFSSRAWSELIQSGKVRGFSIFGTAGGRKPGVAKTEDGTEKPGQEILNPKISMISLVNRPANRTQTPLPVQKSDAPAWARALIQKIEKAAEQVEANSARLKEIEQKRSGKGGNNVTALRKAEAEADATRTVRIAQLEKRHAVLSKRLEALWLQPQIAAGSGMSARAMETDLAIELSKCETELATLRGESAAIGASAFKFRGGRSGVIDAGNLFPAGDSAFEKRPDYAGPEIDLDSDLTL